WDAERCLGLIEEHRVTHTHMVPTMFHRMLSLPGTVRDRYDTSSLRYVLHGAAPCPVDVKRRLIEWLGPVVSEYYAATEGVGTLVDSATWLEHPGTVGKPLREGQVKIGDDSAEELPSGEVGLVWLRAPGNLRFVYYKDEEKTSSAYRGEYFTLGDMGYMDDDGYLFLTDRVADLIISGGVNIYPAEIEAVMLEHPAVGDVGVIGVANAEWGEEVKAVVELAEAHDATDAMAAELIRFARDRLAHYKCPRSIEFTAELPRLENGKLYRRILREQFRRES
ncbi:MAG: AMP-binding protein, partial [Nitrososphaerales archaeon]